MREIKLLPIQNIFPAKNPAFFIPSPKAAAIPLDAGLMKTPRLGFLNKNEKKLT